MEKTMTDTMILVQGGSFLMGSPKNEKGRFADERQHLVQVEDFCLGKHPVTNAEYRFFKPDHDRGAGFNGDDQPVVWVSWHDATDYAEWLSQETGEAYRLPTEAEWEYACRAGTTTRFFFGDKAKRLGEFAWLGSNSGEQTHPVGQKLPNHWGLYDMLGNVWEWTSSVYDPSYGGAETRCAGRGDPVLRVVRGGSWGGRPRLVRSAFRDRDDSANRDDNVGFRLARTVKP